MGRTSTARWKNVRRMALARARRAGQERCPLCQCMLAYGTHGLPTSPEVDHITAWADGGKDTLANVRVVCLRCNRKRGAITGAEHRAGMPVSFGSVDRSARW